MFLPISQYFRTFLNFLLFTNTYVCFPINVSPYLILQVCCFSMPISDFYIFDEVNYLSNGHLFKIDINEQTKFEYEIIFKKPMEKYNNKINQL